MTPLLRFLILGLLMTALACGACACGRGGSPSVRGPSNDRCRTCAAGTDCGRNEHCVTGCCRTVDDENLFE
jgi:hypothetical protein